MNKKRKQCQNKGFICLNLGFVAIFMLASYLEYSFDVCMVKMIDANSISILTQVVTTIVSIVISIIAMAITLQSDECFGINMKDFNLLRVQKGYSLSLTVVLSIILSVLNAMLLVFKMQILSIGISVISVIFCIYVLQKEIPIMTKKERVLLRMVKDKIVFDFIHGKELSKNLKQVLMYLLLDYSTLAETYDKLKLESLDYNKYLIFQLLDIQQTQAFAFHLMDEKQRNEYANHMVDNIRDILFSYFDVIEIVGKEGIQKNRYLITRVLFRTLELKETKQRTENLLISGIKYITYGDMTDEKKDFIFEIVLTLLVGTIKKGEFDLLTRIRKEMVANHSLYQKEYVQAIFALISMYFYYLTNNESNATDEMKIKIKEIMYNELKVGTVKIPSWSKMFESFLNSIPVDFNLFYKGFISNYDNWEVYSEIERVRWVVLDNKYVLKWYFAVLIHSYNFYEYDFNSLRGVYKWIDDDLGDIFDLCYKDNSFHIPDFAKEIIEFYLKNRDGNSFVIFENEEEKFAKFINEIRIEQIEKQTQIAKNIANEEIMEYYRKEIYKSFENEWSFNGLLEISSDIKSFSALFEKAHVAVNYNDIMIESFVDALFEEISQKVEYIELRKSKFFDEEINKIISKKFYAINDYGLYRIKRSISDKKIQDEFTKHASTVPIIHSNIISSPAILPDDKFAFNCEIIQTEMKEISKDAVSKIVEQYKRADGQYVFEGAFLPREKIEEHIKLRHVEFIIRFAYSVQLGEKIIFINLNEESKDNDLVDEL